MPSIETDTFFYLIRSHAHKIRLKHIYRINLQVQQQIHFVGKKRHSGFPNCSNAFLVQIFCAKSPESDSFVLLNTGDGNAVLENALCEYNIYKLFEKNLVYWKVMKRSLRRHELDLICMIYRFTTYRLDIFLDTFVKIYRFSCLLSVFMA